VRRAFVRVLGGGAPSRAVVHETARGRLARPPPFRGKCCAARNRAQADGGAMGGPVRGGGWIPREPTRGGGQRMRCSGSARNDRSRGVGRWSAGCPLYPAVRVRDARPEGRDGAARVRSSGIASTARRGGGPARLATVVSLPTARAARPGAQRRDTPTPRRSSVSCCRRRVRGSGRGGRE